ncbi:O-antigen ligase family protein [Marinomonas algarum]|uniref:O-antigen ligase family protein n=1 Tax=Marinomonas algarum TaxID=2883105 RepID=A0A9X1ILJ8_9GAMM|nr:O-antigen ligase family protein [Marinomonas algarum]MCB5161478.1 O-antigen ligase family protein [Marinomonas algarum]
MSLIARFICLAWFFAGLTFAISVGMPGGYNIGGALIFLSSIGLIFIKPKWALLNKQDRLLFWTFFSFAISMFIAVAMDSMSIRELDKPSRFLVVLPVLVLLLNVTNRKEWLWYSVLFGAIFAFSMALHERVVLGDRRSGVGINEIMFGNTAMLLGLLSFAGAIYFYSQKRYAWMWLSIIGGFAGIGGSVLSGTRGGWVGLPFIGLFLFWQCRDLLGRKLLLSVFSVVILSLVTVVAVPQTGVQKRVNDAVSDITKYLDGSRRATSVGVRFDLWKSSVLIVKQAPIFGVGASQITPLRKELAADNLISKASSRFGHAHNEYFDALAKRGIVGLVFLLMVYLVPLKLFLNKLKEHKTDWRIRSYAIAGALIPMGYIDFSLTQGMLSHNIGVVMYAFPVVYFWAALRWAEREALEEEPMV